MSIPHLCDLRPASDPHTLRAVRSSIETLAQQRQLPGDHPAVRIHLIASLLQQADTCLTHAVRDAVDAGYTNLELRVLTGLA
jgi:hypothetical protein